MSNSPQSTSYHSYSSTDMEGPGHQGEVLSPSNSSETGIAPAHQISVPKGKGFLWDKSLPSPVCKGCNCWNVYHPTYGRSNP